MTTELILIILLGILLFAFMGIALHQAKTNEQLRQYIGELERDLKISRGYAAPNKKGGVPMKKK